MARFTRIRKKAKILLGLALCAALALCVALGAAAETAATVTDYTVVMQNEATGAVYEAPAELTDDPDVLSACLEDVPVGVYTVLVYHLNAAAGNNSLCRSYSWNCEGYYENSILSVRVDYQLSTDGLRFGWFAADAPEDLLGGKTLYLCTYDSAGAEVSRDSLLLKQFNQTLYYDYFVTQQSAQEVRCDVCDDAGTVYASTEIEYAYPSEDAIVDLWVTYDAESGEVAVETHQYPAEITRNSLMRAIVRDESGNEVTRTNLTCVDLDEGYYAAVLNDLAPGDYTVELQTYIVAGESGAFFTQDAQNWTFIDGGSDSNGSLLLVSRDYTLALEELWPEPTLSYMVVVEQADTGDFVLGADLEPQDELYTALRGLVEGLDAGRYNFVITNMGDVEATETLDVGDGEAVDVQYSRVTGTLTLASSGAAEAEEEPTASEAPAETPAQQAAGSSYTAGAVLCLLAVVIAGLGFALRRKKKRSN
jgi:hypothetical protein